jgi:Family of unknown function (DUF5343)
MTALQDGRAPYASTGSIQKVIENHRQMNLPTVNPQKLQQIGVTESLVPRTLYALEALGFYDENGAITPEFDALRKVPEHDFKPRLAALLREAYAPILEVLDPAIATQTDVENAFRGFEPTGQIPRMVQLFMGLMAYAEVMPEVKRRSGPAPGQQAPRAPKNKPMSERGQAGRSGQSGQPVVQSEPEHQSVHQAPPPPSQVDGRPVERRDISLGDAGTVTVIVNVQWLDLSDDQFTKLRQLIKDIEALGSSGPDRSGQVDAEAAPINVPAEHRVVSLPTPLLGSVIWWWAFVCTRTCPGLCRHSRWHPCLRGWRGARFPGCPAPQGRVHRPQPRQRRPAPRGRSRDRRGSDPSRA